MLEQIYLPKTSEYDNYFTAIRKARENFLVNLGSILEKLTRFR